MSEGPEEDESFVYEINTVSFKLPKVRFNFDVSPPPPPPFNLEVYQEIVSQDPHGFQMVRSRLEDIFPRLSDVATSSIGASIGGLIADFEMPAAKITKAYLATHGMTPDGLGARVIQSKHTGRWRGACKELWNLFDDRQKAAAGRQSSAYSNNPHYSDAAYDSPYDRNLLLYAMLEIKLSLDKDSLANVEYSTLTLFDTICGSGVGGYRVPTTSNPTREHSFQEGYEIDTFAPIVNYGSLETLKSAYMASLQNCRGFIGRHGIERILQHGRPLRVTKELPTSRNFTACNIRADFSAQRPPMQC